LKKRLLAVGDSTEIEIIFSSGSRSGGKFSKSPRLYTSDPAVNETRLRLSGSITSPDDSSSSQLLEIDPFGLHALIDDDKNEYKISLKNNSKKLISNHPTFMEVKVPDRAIKPGKSRDIKVKLNDPKQHGTAGFEKSFTIELSDRMKTRYTIPVTYSKEKPQPRQRAAHNTNPAKSGIKPTGLKTKTGNNIDMIKAGTSTK